jgi:hypothetical protein
VFSLNLSITVIVAFADRLDVLSDTFGLLNPFKVLALLLRESGKLVKTPSTLEVGPVFDEK